MYCITAGELDVLLHFLHLVWSKGSQSERPYQAAVDAVRESMTISGSSGLLDDDQRLEFLDEDGPAKLKVLAYWNDVDARLKIRAPLDAL